jgi:hypothetical protein
MAAHELVAGGGRAATLKTIAASTSSETTICAYRQCHVHVRAARGRRTPAATVRLYIYLRRYRAAVAPPSRTRSTKYRLVLRIRGSSDLL